MKLTRLSKLICFGLSSMLGIGCAVAISNAVSQKEAVCAEAANVKAELTYTEIGKYTSDGSGTYVDPSGMGTWTWSGVASKTDYNFDVSTTTPFVWTFTLSSTAGRLYAASFYFDVDNTITFPSGIAGSFSGMGSVSTQATVKTSTTTYLCQQLSGFDFTKNYITFTSGLPSATAKFKGLPVASLNFTISYNVDLDKQGGTGGDSSVTATYGADMPTISVPSKAGYEFLGYWSETGGAGTQYYKSNGTSAHTYDLAHTTILYANWKLTTYTISYNLNGGTVSPANPTSYQYTSSSFTLNNPTKTGYTFKGWTGTDISTPTMTVTISSGSSGNRSYTANWEANKTTVTLNMKGGSSGTSSVTATYDSAMPSATAPTKSKYSFTGYYDVDSETGGTKYYNVDMSSAHKWDKTSSTAILYARYTINMDLEVSMSSGWTGTWDGNKYWPVVTAKNAVTGEVLTGVTIYYGTNESAITDTNLDHFKYSDAGKYTVYYKVTKSGFTDTIGGKMFTINKAESVVDPIPEAITGLEYTSNNQALINAGTVDYGSMLYAVSNTLELPSDDKFSTNIPTGNKVGTYYVFYKSSGDANHNPYPASVGNAITVSIARVDRTEVENLNDVVVTYLGTIETRFPTIASTLESVRAEVYQDAIVEDNITAEGVAENVIKLQNALSAAKVDVTETLINLIGTSIVYPTSKESVYEAYNYYTNVLSDDEKAMVDSDLVTALMGYKDLYDTVENLVDLIKAIPEPAESKEYYDAVDLAYAFYVDLTNTQYDVFHNAVDYNWEKELLDHLGARNVIEYIDDIDQVKYNHGNDDSLQDIEKAEAAYAALSDDQKAIVNGVNHDTLVNDRIIYDNVNNCVLLIEKIGEVTNTEECKAKIDDAREAYDKLTEEEKALVGGFNYSYQVLEDDEHVYHALVLIDAIGEVGYNYESEEAIKEAREYYDSLTDAQKVQLGDDPFKILTSAETTYAGAEKTATIWLIVLFVLVGLLILGGIFFIIFLLKRRKDKDDEDDQNQNGGNKKMVKAASIGGILPFIFLVSHWVDGQFITLYVLAGFAILLWIAVLVIVILKKKGVIANKSVMASTATSVSSSSSYSGMPLMGSGEEVTYTDEKGNIFQIRFIKSFTAKLIQSTDETKKYYEELKNEVMSYKGVNSRVSWHYDSVTSSRNPVVKFAIRGKTLCVYFPLNADEYNDSKYKVEKSESKRFEDTPCLYRIKNDRRVGYAKELIAKVCESLRLKKGEAKHDSYVLPFEENKPLIDRGLIKEQKIQVKKSEESVVLESKVNADGDEIIVKKDASGNIFEIRFIKSFSAKLSQASDEVKDYYNALKNYALSYKGLSARVSWHYDSLNYGREQILKFAIRGKTLCVYFALDSEGLDPKYKVEKVESKKFSEVPCLYRIKNDRRFAYAKELIDLLMNKLDIKQGKEPNDDYRLPYEETKVLLAKDLIKEVKSSVKEKENIKHVSKVSAEEADSLMSDEVAEHLIEEDKNSKVHAGKKGIINLDDLENNFNDGDTITLEALIEKKLVAKDVGRVKLLARGTLDKKFHVDLQDYSLQAVKMVLLVGGTVQKAK